MKKTILFLLLISLGVLFAELEVDIPFDQNIIGDDFSIVGVYDYESEWITITNIGTTTETYTLFYSNENVPSNWNLSICNPSFCLAPNWPVPIELSPGAFEEIHIAIHVASTGGFDFVIILDEGDLTEPINLVFRFDTADNVSADEELIQAFKLGQNYPNPFNPSTTISLNLSSEESAIANLNIYNSRGQIVKTFDQITDNVVWNGLDDAGKTVNSGIYFYQLKIDEQSFTRKMVLLK